MHIRTTELQNLITLFPVQPQMACHLEQVTNITSQFLSELQFTTTESLRLEETTRRLHTEAGGHQTLTGSLRTLIPSGSDSLQGLTPQLLWGTGSVPSSHSQGCICALPV